MIRPNSFLQKAISEVSNKFFKEEFKFKVFICSSVEELHEYVDSTELTVDLSGTLPYFHQHWIQQRMVPYKIKKLFYTKYWYNCFFILYLYDFRL